MKQNLKVKAAGNLRKIGIIAITILMVLSLVATALYLGFNRDEVAKATATVPSNSTSTINGVLLDDTTSSMKAPSTIKCFYKDCLEFAWKTGCSEIAEAVNDTIPGYNRLGIYSDFKQTGGTWQLKKIENREIILYAAPGSKPKDMLNAWNAFKKATNSTNCTLKLYRADGTLVRSIGENYTSSDTSTATATATAGTSVPRSVVICILEAGILIIGLILIFVLALWGYIVRTFTDPTPDDDKEPIDEAVNADVLAFDASTSVKGMFDKFGQYCLDKGVQDCIRFASTAEWMKLDQALALAPEGQTAGYQAMKMAYDKGAKILTVLTDGGFNDQPEIANGIYFEKIFFVGENLSQADIAHLTHFAKNFEIVTL